MLVRRENFSQKIYVETERASISLCVCSQIFRRSRFLGPAWNTFVHLYSLQENLWFGIQST